MARPLAWGALYLVAEGGLRAAAIPADHAVPWSPGAGIALVAIVAEGPLAAAVLLLLRLGIAAWPHGGVDGADVASAIGVAGAYLAGALLVRRRVAWRAGVWRVRDALWLIVGIVGASSAAAVAMLPSLATDADGATLLRHAAARAAESAAGAMVIVPITFFVLLPALRARRLDDRREPPRRRRHHDRRGRERAAQAVVVAATIVVGVVAHLHGRTGLGYACFLPLAWVALRDGVRGAAVVTVAYGLACGIAGLWLGLAPHQLLDSQLALLNLGAVGLLLGTTRQRAGSGVRHLHLLATAGEGVWHVDREGCTRYVNARAAAMLGRTPEELAGQTLLEVVVPEERAYAAARIAAAAGGDDRPWETTLARASAAPFPVLVRMRPVFAAATGEPLGAVAMLTDISAWRNAERRRDDTDGAGDWADDLLNAVFRASRDAMLVVGSDGVVVASNHAWGRTFGDSSPSGMPLAALPLWADPQEVARLLRVVRDAAERGETVHDFALDIARSRTDGGADRGRALVTVATATVDERTYHLLACRDATQEQRAREERERVGRFEELGRLAAGIAHDFNNLLTVMSSYAHLIRTAAARGQGVDPSDADEIARAAARGTALTAHLLAFGRNQRIEPHAVDLNDLVRTSRGMVRALLGPRMSIDYQLTDAALPIIADAVQLDQVLLNLVVNAVDAMPDGGSIVIATGRIRVRAEDVPEGSGARAGEFATLDVIDSGHGMDDTTRARIFEPFFTTKEAGRGTGLGLAVVGGVVRHAGGFVRVRSARGGGTTMRVCWPLATVHAQTTPGERSSFSRDARVLVVDDDEVVRQLVTRALKDAGFRTASAGSGQEALEQLATRWPAGGGPSVIVTDVTVAGAGGRQLAVTLADERPDLPVVLISALDAADGASLPARGRPFSRRAFDAEALVRQVRAALAHRDMGDAVA